jgi:hypothetical protein
VGLALLGPLPLNGGRWQGLAAAAVPAPQPCACARCTPPATPPPGARAPLPPNANATPRRATRPARAGTWRSWRR